MGSFCAVFYLEIIILSFPFQSLPKVVQHCPWLIGDSSAKDLDKLIAQWKTRKYKKPVRGAIILNPELTKVCVQ